MDITIHQQAFRDLIKLCGTWQGHTPAGRTLNVTYTHHANCSVLMEQWYLNETTDALTLYHMDDEILMATHYCPLCNQPRLNLVYRSNDELGFEFVSATNLTDLTQSHQHSFQFRLIDANVFWRSETYIGAGGFVESATFGRVGADLE